MKSSAQSGRGIDLEPLGADELSLPIRYWGVRTLVVTLAARRDRLESLLPRSLRASRLYGDYGGLVVQFVDMPRTTIGPYRESVIGVLCKDTLPWPEPADDVGWRPQACLPLWMTVTSEKARASGQEVWGYPKIVAETEVHVEGSRLHGRVLIDGAVVLECRAELPGEPARVPIEMRTLTRKRGVLCQSVIRGEADLAIQERPRCEVSFGDRLEIAGAIRELGVDPQPFACMYLSEFDYTLEAPFAEEQP